MPFITLYLHTYLIQLFSLPIMTPPVCPTVVVLGAGYSGIGVSHKLLKYTREKVPNLKIILVSPSSHHFWNIAAVRGIVPGEFSDDDLFRDIASGFEKSPQDAFEFVLGAAAAVDEVANTVRIDTVDGPRTIAFTHLVVATGSSYPTRLPFTNLESRKDTVAALHDLQAKVQDARSIVIAGSGPTGVETAAELGNAFGRTKQITLIVEGDQPLPGLMPEVRKTAAVALEKLGVTLARNSRVATSSTTGEDTLVTLKTGETLKADLYLPFFGMSPNTGFMPPQFLDPSGSIKLDKTLRVAGLANVWCAGDVGNLQRKQLIYAEKQAHHLAGNLHAVVTGDDDGVRDMKIGNSPQFWVTLGKRGGTGQWLGIQLPGLIVSMSKGKSFFSEKGVGLVAGENIVRSSI